MDSKETNTRIAADFGIQLHLEMGLFPSVTRVYRFLKTAPCKFAKGKIVQETENFGNNEARWQRKGKTIWWFSHAKKMWRTWENVRSRFINIELK